MYWRLVKNRRILSAQPIKIAKWSFSTETQLSPKLLRKKVPKTCFLHSLIKVRIILYKRYILSNFCLKLQRKSLLSTDNGPLFIQLTLCTLTSSKNLSTSIFHNSKLLWREKAFSIRKLFCNLNPQKRPPYLALEWSLWVFSWKRTVQTVITIEISLFVSRFLRKKKKG